MMVNICWINVETMYSWEVSFGKYFMDTIVVHGIAKVWAKLLHVLIIRGERGESKSFAVGACLIVTTSMTWQMTFESPTSNTKCMTHKSLKQITVYNGNEKWGN